MTIIKRFINWIISLFRRLFKVNKKNKNKVISKKKINNKKKNNQANINPLFNESLPSYMIINNKEKEKLLYSISLMIALLNETNIKKKEIEEAKLFKLIKEKYNISVTEIISQRQLETLIKEIKQEDKEEIINQYQINVKKDNDFKVHIEEIEKIVSLIKQKDLSIIDEIEIENEIDQVVNDKNLTDTYEEKIDYFNKNVCNIIDNVDKDFLSEVKKEYNTINYVTVSTLFIDKEYEKFNKLQDDFKHHRYNRFYYEREIKKLKQELNKIKNLKNNKEVNEHIEKLRKELYTKSKDKYDLLYNNEIFMNFNKECDNLLDKINTKVVDIKKEKEKVEVPKEEEKKNKYLENILKRFQDMSLARRIILLSQMEDQELINDPNYDFAHEIIKKYNNGLNEEFNFDRNKKKTELVILFNELNLAINKINKEPIINVDHINFRMNDLTEAVEVKKNELGKLLNTDLSKEEKKDEKTKTLVYKPNNEKNNQDKKSIL